MIPWIEAESPAAGTRVVVGLSGGVDSAVTALRLQEMGCEVLGVTTKNFCTTDLPTEVEPDESSCCGDEAIEAARELCADLAIPHRVIDLATVFAPQVIEDFGSEYLVGRTPNPCVRCNRYVRFPGLLRFADAMGAELVATGHYARRVEHPQSGSHVARAKELSKDQSYYLHGLTSAELARSVFPLGSSTKDEVREEARRRGLPCAEAPESQEICFVPGGDRRPFLGPGEASGEVVDRQGRVLGEHEGVSGFTVGQRKGLGLGGGKMRFVVELDAQNHRVVIGDEAELLRTRMFCDQAWMRDPVESAEGLVVRTRSRHSGRPVARRVFTEGRLELVLSEPDRAPAPGQSVVLYRDEVVVGGARLMEARCDAS